MKLNVLEKIIVLNPLRKWVQRHVEIPFLCSKGDALVETSQVLEVGASVGYGANCLKSFYGLSNVVAVEYDFSLLKRRGHYSGVLFVNGGGHQLPLAKNSVDAIFSFGVLHHIIEWQRAMEEWSVILKGDGQIFLEEFYAPLITNSFVNVFIKHPQENRFTHEQLIDIARQCGLKVVYEKKLFGLMGWVVLKKV